ncbi:DUF1697 domain-containing protein [Ideonella sp. A 288]|uniref:DUF1697 domain-containing protein n=1 Tax=Ideonella sp. A 288 TaxID=1962181 RepID=UPI000B4AD475|nr:DUF1697 domain-containing protein [Ideonella sp. A 288]
MPGFAALLHGVNVGHGSRVPMAELCGPWESLGCTDGRTLPDRDDAVFANRGRSTSAHAQTIRQALVSKVGIRVPVIVRLAPVSAPRINLETQQRSGTTKTTQSSSTSPRNPPL